MKPIDVLISDDNAVIREHLPKLLAAENDIRVTGVAGDGSEAYRKALELRPDVVIMDLKMPKMDGIEATKRIKQHMPDAQVIILSVYDRAAYVTQSLRAGASTYLYKGTTVDQLADTIRRVFKERHPA